MPSLTTLKGNAMGNLSKETLENLLAVIILLEHKTKHEVKHEEYEAIVRLCQACNAPQFITEYFARKKVIGEFKELNDMQELYSNP